MFVKFIFKNQIMLFKVVVFGVDVVEYFDVIVEGGWIVLMLVWVQKVQVVCEKLE